jgi:hypothetical protein
MGDRLSSFLLQGLLDRGGSVDLVSQPKTETSPGMPIWAFWLVNNQELSQSLLDVGCVEDFTADLPRWWWRHQPHRQWSFCHFGCSFVFNIFDYSIYLID